MERAPLLDSIEQRERGEREEKRAKARRELPQRVEALLGKHNLTVPESTAEMIAKTIMKCRELEPKPKKQKGKRPSPRERLQKARTHARKLLQYTEDRPSHKDSISRQSTSLRKALNDWDAVIWLAVANPPMDVPELLNKPMLDRDTLTSLIGALDAVLCRYGARTGRPREEISRIVRACCIAWLRAGYRGGYGWDDVVTEPAAPPGFGSHLGVSRPPTTRPLPAEPLVGPLPRFIRDLLSLCAGPKKDFSLTDAALHSQLKVALPYCERVLKRRAR